MTRRKQAHKILPPVPARRSAPAKSSKGPQMKQVFKDLFMSFAGDFTVERPNWFIEKMIGWIRYHGAHYESEVTDQTTHLICTILEYKKKTAQVQKALMLGKRCSIVVADWLEDCLTVQNSKKRCIAVKGYTLSRVLKRIHKTKLAQQRYRESFEDGVRAGHSFVDNRLSRIYCDPDGFEYKAVCTRINTDGRVKAEKYTLYLFQSLAKPHSYMFGAKLTSVGKRASYYKLDCYPKQFQPAFDDFKKYFKKKTGLDWDDRLENHPHDPEKFLYNKPIGGRPVGQLPPGRKAPWDRKLQNKEQEDSNSNSEADSGIAMNADDYDSESDVEDESDTE